MNKKSYFFSNICSILDKNSLHRYFMRNIPSHSANKKIELFHKSELTSEKQINICSILDQIR